MDNLEEKKNSNEQNAEIDNTKLLNEEELEKVSGGMVDYLEDPSQNRDGTPVLCASQLIFRHK